MRYEAPLAAAAIPLAMAQSSNSSMSTVTPTYVTMTIDDCDSTTPETMITVTNGVTETYCPMCTDMIPHTTIYTTYYDALCTSGEMWSMTPQVYTVTESCTEATPTWSSGTSYIPPGFTVTQYECTTCDTAPVTYTVTEPCDCTMTNGAGSPSTAGAAPTPGDSGGLGNGSPAPGSGAGSGGSSPTTSAAGGGSPGSTSTPAPGSNGGSGAGSSPALYPTTTTVACPGPECKMLAPSSYPTGANYGNTSGIEPWTGSAASFSVAGAFTALVALCVGSLAVLL